MKATPSRVTEAPETNALHLTDVSWGDVRAEAVTTGRLDDVLAFGVVALLAIGGLFISWVLFAPKALDLLK